MFKALRKWLWNLRLKRAYSRPNLSLDDYMKLMSAAPREMLPKANVELVEARHRLEQADVHHRMREAEHREAERLARIKEISELHAKS